jgi:hypothetical protein
VASRCTCLARVRNVCDVCVRMAGPHLSGFSKIRTSTTTQRCDSSNQDSFRDAPGLLFFSSQFQLVNEVWPAQSTRHSQVRTAGLVAHAGTHIPQCEYLTRTSAPLYHFRPHHTTWFTRSPASDLRIAGKQAVQHACQQSVACANPATPGGCWHPRPVSSTAVAAECTDGGRWRHWRHWREHSRVDQSGH